MVPDLFAQYPGVFAGIGSVGAILIAVAAKLQYKKSHKPQLSPREQKQLV